MASPIATLLTDWSVVAVHAYAGFTEPAHRFICTADPESWDLNNWLDSMKFSNYAPNFLNEGYDRLDAVCAHIIPGLL